MDPILNRNEMKHDRRQAFSLLETIVVLTIVSLVISGLWLGYSTIRLRQQANETVAGLLVIASKLSEAYGGVVPKTGENIAHSAYLAHWMPQSWGYDATTDSIITPIGPAYLGLSPLTWEMDFTVTFESLTESQCNAMVMALKSIITTSPKNFLQVDTALDSWYDRTNGFYVNVPSCMGSVAKGLAPSIYIYMNI